MEVGNKVLVTDVSSPFFNHKGIVEDFENMNKRDGDALVLVRFGKKLYWFLACDLCE